MERGSDAPSIGLADLAMIRAASAWDSVPGERFWTLLPPEERARLKAAWEARGSETPARAMEMLRREHQAQFRADLSRVHPSWWARALRDEPRSVRLAVLANLPRGQAETLAEELELREDVPTSPASTASFAVEAALTLWTERLVGDLPERDDDPPVIAALTRLRGGEIARLFRVTGLVKWSATTVIPRPSVPDEADRLDRLKERLAGLDPRASLVAERDLAAIDPATPRSDTRLGLLSFARLLAFADPHRTRWALQHLPYPSARSIRRIIERQPPRTTLLGRFETRFLRVAWIDLHETGRLGESWTWGDEP